jgi:putative transposase
MPSKNSIKQFTADGYYHIYNRGVAKSQIFLDDEDYAVFLNLLKRYLGKEPAKDKFGREYPWFNKNITLLAFCLMQNHFHLLIYQKEPDMMTALMRGLLTSYTGYFNRKYKRAGHLFQGIYKAVLIDQDAYLQHITRYIHLNPEGYKNYEWSSLQYYLGKKRAEWINPEEVLAIFNDISYEDFIANYEDYKKELDDLKSQLADY